MIKDGEKLGGAFLDIRDRVQSGGERGLLSVAFSPFYANNRRFYVFYTDRRGDLVVAEYRASRKDPRDAKEASARTVIKVRHRENANHNGGQLQFGPDGDLYISTGDGGSGGDPPENAQNKNRLLGKILRIDPRKPRARGAAPGAATRSRAATRSSARPAPTRSSRSGSATRTASPSTAAASRSATSARTRARRSTTRSWAARTAPTSAGTRSRATSASPPPTRARPRPGTSGRSSTTPTTGAARSPAATSSATSGSPRFAGRYVYADYCRGRDPLADPGHRRRPRRPLGRARQRERDLELRRGQPGPALVRERRRRSRRGRSSPGRARPRARPGGICLAVQPVGIESDLQLDDDRERDRWKRRRARRRRPASATAQARAPRPAPETIEVRRPTDGSLIREVGDRQPGARRRDRRAGPQQPAVLGGARDRGPLPLARPSARLAARQQRRGRRPAQGGDRQGPLRRRARGSLRRRRDQLLRRERGRPTWPTRSSRAGRR